MWSTIRETTTEPGATSGELQSLSIANQAVVFVAALIAPSSCILLMLFMSYDALWIDPSDIIGMEISDSAPQIWNGACLLLRTRCPIMSDVLIWATFMKSILIVWYASML